MTIMIIVLTIIISMIIRRRMCYNNCIYYFSLLLFLLFVLLSLIITTIPVNTAPKTAPSQPQRKAALTPFFSPRSESEASGSALVTPIQHRRRVSHGLPSQHPHRRRKVSAPPELLQHLGSAITHVAAAHAITGSANPDHADRPHPEFILSFAPGQTHCKWPQFVLCSFSLELKLSLLSL